MRLLKLVPANPKIGFIKAHKILVSLSIIGIIVGFGLIFVTGLNFGIDFRGGTEIEIKTPGVADIGKIRSVVDNLGLGEVQVQQFGKPNDVLVRVQTQKVSAAALKADPTAAEKAQQAAAKKVSNALVNDIGKGVIIEGTSIVGPEVSAELVQKGVLAIVVGVGLMFVYIWFRFEWQFSIGATLALMHDVSLTVGLFALTQMEFNLSVVAAILLIIGYSMNDTVVVYDRIRENLRKYKKMGLSELIDLSINETLSRTTMTSTTTLLALGGLYVFGTEVIRGFTLAMIWGIFVGTYSSIFIASPVLLYTNVKRDWSGVSKEGAGAPAARGT
jgi:preprotein translocase subunit SecF